MNETVEFPVNDQVASGYLARPDGGSGPGSGPGVLVIQEWWGLDWGIKAMADRLAAAGFVALAPDLFHGELAEHDEMDKAGHLMTSMPAERAANDMSAAIDFLVSHPNVSRASDGSTGVGVVGFCMGGMLAFLVAANRPDQVKAVAPFYGFPQGDAEPDWTRLTASVRGHMAEYDDFFLPEAALALESKLRAMGKDVTLTVHPGTGHAFMAPHNALGTLNEEVAASVWPQVTAFLHETLG
jgi:carboxymethylenebutenolidase